MLPKLAQQCFYFIKQQIASDKIGNLKAILTCCGFSDIRVLLTSHQLSIMQNLIDFLWGTILH